MSDDINCDQVEDVSALINMKMDDVPFVDVIEKERACANIITDAETL